MKRSLIRKTDDSARKPHSDFEDTDSDCSDSSEDDKGREQASISSTIRFYLVAVVALLLGLSFLYERDMRMQLINEYNHNIDKASRQLADMKKRIDSGSHCEECPECEEVQDASISSIDTNHEYNYMQWDSRDKKMTAELKMLSRKLLEIEFGPPPYYVEFDVVIDKYTVEGGKLSFEMADPELMPYSMYFFMRKVKEGAWDNCGFSINLGVVYPEPALGSSMCNTDKFKGPDGNIETLAFQEYSEKVPHDVLTLGISGRPGGLGVYISGQDNTKPLGPKGEREAGDPPLDADPTIGKLVQGEDLFIRLKRICKEASLDGTPGDRLFLDIGGFLQYVRIGTARVVPKSSVVLAV